jgi:HK97 family phage prohead protease
MRERRSQPTEIRAEGRTISGYAAKFNTLSHDLGGFVETIAPGAFDLDGSPSVILNFDHDDRLMLGRTDSGTLKLRQDDIGLFFECELPEQSPLLNVAGLIEQITRKDLKGCSFAFDVVGDDGDEWGETEDGKKLRTLTHVQLFDVCPTPCPAYEDTEVAIRSLRRHLARPNLERAKRLLRLVDASLHR